MATTCATAVGESGRKSVTCAEKGMTAYGAYLPVSGMVQCDPQIGGVVQTAPVSVLCEQAQQVSVK